MGTDWPEKIEKLLIDGSVLDLGCGSGRFYPVFQNRDYTGIDKDTNFAETLSKQYPKGKWVEQDITIWKPSTTYNNVFSWVTSQHIPPKEFKILAEKIKKITGNIIFCERATGPDPSDSGYLWKHNYQELFPGIKIIEEIVKDVWLMNWRKDEN